MEEVTGKNYYLVKTDPELTFSQDQYLRWKEVADQLEKGVPLQYALGKAWFIDLELQVGPGVLIPRPETEELADLAEKTALYIKGLPHRQQSSPTPSLKILDIGTGSGCIAIYLARKLKGAHIIANDVSEIALTTAQKNASIYKVSIEPFLMDTLQASPNQFSDLDLIVSNPPYIPISEKAEMDALVTKNEPDLALFVSDEDPLVFYEKTAKLSKDWLQPWGSVLCETHENLAQEVTKLFQDIGFQQVEIIRDLQGKERMVRAFLQKA